MKNFLIIVLLIGVWILYKKKVLHELQESREETASQPTQQGAPTAAAQPASRKISPQAPSSGVLHGNYSDSSSAAHLAIDVTDQEAAGYQVGDSVRLFNSALYPLYYRILSIDQKEEGIKTIVLNTLFVGIESDVYLTSDKYTISGFSGSLKTNKNLLFL